MKRIQVSDVLSFVAQLSENDVNRILDAIESDDLRRLQLAINRYLKELDNEDEVS